MRVPICSVASDKSFLTLLDNVLHSLCCATVGWMSYYAVWFIRGEGVMIFRSNLIMFWLLALATLLTAFAGFKHPHKYIAASAVAVIIAAYSYAFPILVRGIRFFHGNSSHQPAVSK
jgi:hypothetical protein